MEVIGSLQPQVDSEALARAVQAGDAEQVKALLRAGASAQIDDAELDPLIMACKSGSDGILRLLLPQVNVNKRYSNGRLALSYCLLNATLLSTLLDGGADPSIALSIERTHLELTPMHLLAFQSEGSAVSRGDFLRIVQALVKTGVSCDSRNRRGETALQMMVNRASPCRGFPNGGPPYWRSELAHALIAAGADTRLVDGEGRNIWHYVMSWRELATAEQVIELMRSDPHLAVNMSVTDCWGAVPLDYERLFCGRSIVFSGPLLECKPVSIIAGEPWLALYRRLQNPTRSDNWFDKSFTGGLFEPIRQACGGDATRLKAAVNQRDMFGASLLHLAVINRAAGLVELLVNAGAEVDSRASACALGVVVHPHAQKYQGQTALSATSLAVYRDEASMLKTLLAAGADPNQLADERSPSGERLLHVAAGGASNSLYLVRNLIEAGADVSALTTDGTSVAMYAAVSPTPIRDYDECPYIAPLFNVLESLMEADADIGHISPASALRAKHKGLLAFHHTSPAAVLMRRFSGHLFEEHPVTEIILATAEGHKTAAAAVAARFDLLGNYYASRLQSILPSEAEEALQLQRTADVILYSGVTFWFCCLHGIMTTGSSNCGPSLYIEHRCVEVLYVSKEFSRDVLPVIAPLYLRVARYHPPALQAPDWRFSYCWALALISCIVTSGWGPMPQLVIELQTRVAGCTIDASQKSGTLLRALLPLGGYFPSPTSSSVVAGVESAVSVLAIALSSPLLTAEDLAFLVDRFIVAATHPAILSVLYQLGRYQPSPLWAFRPLPLSSAVLLSKAAAVRFMLQQGADPNALQPRSPLWALAKSAPWLQDVSKGSAILDDLVAAGADVNATTTVYICSGPGTAGVYAARPIIELFLS